MIENYLYFVCEKKRCLICQNSIE
uniref:Uncharacterized protein n=1 Tax=Rhizophora mucronata TaxID=61149 RepID=A0A2P2QH37_RHIMU